MIEYFKVRKWTKHIIKRFGRINYSLCPCMTLNKKCMYCQYREELKVLNYHHMDCKKAYKYHKLSEDIKNKIRIKVKRLK